MCLLLVTDRTIVPGGDLVGAATAVLRWLRPGSVMVQLRESDLSGRALLDLAEALLPVCREREAPLLIHDRLDVAMAAGADGVDLPQHGFDVAHVRSVWPEAVVSVSCSSPAQAARAQRMGADLAVLGPIYPTLGPDAVGEAREQVGPDFPLYGLGGITAESAPAIHGAGASGAAVIRGVLGDLDPVAAACLIARVWGETTRSPPMLDSSFAVDQDA